MNDYQEEVKLYDYMDGMRDICSIAPSSSQIKRRRMASALQKISENITRMDACEDELELYSNDLEAMAMRLSGHGKINSTHIFQKLYSGVATADELMFDSESELLIGKASPIAFPIKLEMIDDKINGNACVPVSYQGPPERVHGGVVACMFDVLLSRTQLLCDFLGFTASLKVDYKGAVPLGKVLELEAWVVEVDEGKLFNAGKISVDGKVCATAEGLWIKPKHGFGPAHNSVL